MALPEVPVTYTTEDILANIGIDEEDCIEEPRQVAGKKRRLKVKYCSCLGMISHGVAY